MTLTQTPLTVGPGESVTLVWPEHNGAAYQQEFANQTTHDVEITRLYWDEKGRPTADWEE